MVERNFGDLVQSGMFSKRSKDDKNVSLSVGCYGGMTSLTVFTGAGGKPWSTTIPRDTIPAFVLILRKLKENPSAGSRKPVFIQKYQENENGRGGKYVQAGCLGFGIDETMNFYIDISANDLTGRHIFVIKPNPKYDFSNTELTEKDMLFASIDAFIHLLVNSTDSGERLTAFKKTPTGNSQSGGNRNFGGNSGGNRNYGNTSNDNRSSGNNRGTFSGGNSGGVDIDDDLAI